MERQILVVEDEAILTRIREIIATAPHDELSDVRFVGVHEVAANPELAEMVRRSNEPPILPAAIEPRMLFVGNGVGLETHFLKRYIQERESLKLQLVKSPWTDRPWECLRDLPDRGRTSRKSKRARKR